MYFKNAIVTVAMFIAICLVSTQSSFAQNCCRWVKAAHSCRPCCSTVCTPRVICNRVCHRSCGRVASCVVQRAPHSFCGTQMMGGGVAVGAMASVVQTQPSYFPAQTSPNQMFYPSQSYSLQGAIQGNMPMGAMSSQCINQTCYNSCRQCGNSRSYCHSQCCMSTSSFCYTCNGLVICHGNDMMWVQ